MKRLLYLLPLLFSLHLSAQTKIRIGGPGSSASTPSLQSIAFTSSIPFTHGVTVIASHTVTANVTLTPNTTGAIAGAAAYLRIVTDSVHSVDITAFKPSNLSYGIDNRQGIINLLKFWYDGTDYWVSVEQELAAAPVDGVAPTVVLASVENTDPGVLKLQMSEDVSSTLPIASSFVATQGSSTFTGASITRPTPDVVMVTMPSPFAAGPSITYSYTQPGSNKLKDLAGNFLANVSGASVTNNLSSGVFQVTGADWTGSSGSWSVTAGGAMNLGVTTQQLTPGKYLVVKCTATTSGGIRVGITNSPIAGSYTLINYEVKIASSGQIDLNGAYWDVQSSPITFKVANEAGTFKAYYSLNDGSSYTLIGNLAVSPSGGPYYGAVYMQDGSISNAQVF